ncbi:hypothetical protein T05_8643 [Trichinella murrelli]|uniref:Uncharacterized protein n=1 Tax=Trichinella murrelli TaxID=144512 RepID=A0A0V0TLE4_9BILA|nr:hypothetical protein T05_8643 [Trichinella murrelli]
MQSSLCLTVKRGKEKEGDKNDRRTKRGKMILLATKQLDAQAANPTTNNYALRREIKRENRKISKMHGTN